MIRQIPQIALLVYLACQSHLAAAEDSPNGVLKSPRANRVEELFIWKISESLNLSVREEKEISQMIQELNEQKQGLSEDIDEIQKQMQSATSDENAKKMLQTYKSALKKYNQVSINEVDRVQKLLKPQQAAKYFTVKANLSQRIRSILGGNNRADGRWHADRTKPEKPSVSLPDPKIIEE